MVILQKMIVSAGVFLLAISLIPHQTLADDHYPISLDRPAHVGDHWHLESSTTQTTTQIELATGEQIGNSVHQDKMSAEEEVLQTDAMGRVIAAKLSVHSMGDADAGVNRVPPNSVLIVKIIDGKLVTTKDGVAVIQLFDLPNFIVMKAADESTSDEKCFGTADSQCPGAFWLPNATALNAIYKAENILIDPADLKATVTLVGVKNVQGTDCLELRAQEDVRKFSASHQPAFVRASEGKSITSTTQFAIPLTAGLPILSYMKTTTFDQIMSMTNGGRTVVFRSTFTMEYTRLVSDVHLAADK
jgi:hypothetical protein